MDREALWAVVPGVSKESDTTEATEHTRAIHIKGCLAWRKEKAMAPHSSTLTWRIPGAGEPGGLPSVGSLRVGHD